MEEPTTGSILAGLTALRQRSFESEAERLKIKNALELAVASVETPWETALRLAFVQPALLAALKVCWDLALFQKWAELPAVQSAQTSTQLAQLVGVDETLLARTLRHIAAANIVSHASGMYNLTSFSTALGTTDLGSTLVYAFDTSLPGFSNLPGFLKKTNYRNPVEAEYTNWHDMHGQSRFDYLARNPEQMLHFQRVMSMRTHSQPAWTDVYPIDGAIDPRYLREGRALVVDVGGGNGSDLARIHSRAGSVATRPESLVLQDQASVLQNATVLEGMVHMEHDFFEEQPVTGARIYYLHKVLHDWPDAEATKILRRLADAMEKDYSRILLHETVITTDVSSYNTALDMTMMMALSSFERTEGMWNDLVIAAGLKVEKIWTSPASAESIIEVIRECT